jgi:hypothetical protein
METSKTKKEFSDFIKSIEIHPNAPKAKVASKEKSKPKTKPKPKPEPENNTEDNQKTNSKLA